MSEKIANHATKVKQTGDDLMTVAIHAPEKKRYLCLANQRCQE